MDKHMTRADRETWLIRFANRVLEDEDIPYVERNKLIRQLWDFGHHKRSAPLPYGGTITRDSTEGLGKCTWNNVVEANDRTHSAIAGLLGREKTPSWEVSFQMSVGGVGAETSSGGLSHGEVYQVTRNALDAFTFEMCVTLARLGGKIARCPAFQPIDDAVRCKPDEHPHLVCNKIFIRSRRDKQFCSPACRVREAMRKSRRRYRETRKKTISPLLEHIRKGANHGQKIR